MATQIATQTRNSAPRGRGNTRGTGLGSDTTTNDKNTTAPCLRWLLGWKGNKGGHAKRGRRSQRRQGRGVATLNTTPGTRDDSKQNKEENTESLFHTHCGPPALFIPRVSAHIKRSHSRRTNSPSTESDQFSFRSS
ncbi:hypothetical protein E2C01_020073 [Portunus trituberculatus]|uniref:Uncharacterized protein n=1 Tax=Portunus trituberculatus TaxID=210409 RepID=A0A5B7DYW3_PORTR|nr:hypothetical protein [Portunus trituberculatus]